MGFPVSHITWDPTRVPRDFTYEAITLFGRAFQPFLLSFGNPTLWSRNPLDTSIKSLGSSPFARRYLGNQCLFLFLGILRCFTSPSVASYPYVFKIRYHGIARGGFSHSEISGS